MPDDTTRGVPPAGTSPHSSPGEGRPPEVGDPTASAMQASSGEPARAGDGRHSGEPVSADGDRPSGEPAGGGGDRPDEPTGAAQGTGDPTAAREVAASGTALHRDERDSGLDLGDAPGTAGTGAGG